MRIIQIKASENNGHAYQTIDKLTKLPAGWAIIPDDMETLNLPYGEFEVKKICGVPTVTSWTPKPIPEQTVTFTPSLEDDMQSMIVEQAFHLTMLELEVENALQNT